MNVLVLLASLQLYVKTKEILLCSVIFALIPLAVDMTIALGLSQGTDRLLLILIRAGARFGLAYLYFRLLDHFDETGWYWWTLVLGLIVLAFL